MFQIKDCRYEWNSKFYDKFDDAFSAMCASMCKDNTSVEFGDLSGLCLRGRALAQFTLVYAIYHMDILALIRSADSAQYEKLTHTQVPTWLGKHNPLSARNYTIPIHYTSNRNMQCIIWPALEEAYNKCVGFISTKRGKFPDETVLSYICDITLFSGDTPIKEALNVFTVLGQDSRTSDLEKHATHADYHKLKVLAAQLGAGDITVPDNDFISIGDVRASRYACRTKDEIYGNSRYVDDMLLLPPSMQSEDYYTWLLNAAEATGREIRMPVEIAEETEPVNVDVNSEQSAVHTEDEIPTVPTESAGYIPGKTHFDEARIASLIETVKDSDTDMRYVCEEYCEKNGIPYVVVTTMLRRMGLTSNEDVYRAVPVYLRRQGKPVDTALLAKYCVKLSECFGDCTLRCDV